MTVLIILGILVGLGILVWVAISLERYSRNRYSFSIFTWWHLGTLVASLGLFVLAAFLVPEGEELTGILERAIALDVTLEASNSVVLVGLGLLVGVAVLGRLVVKTNLLLGVAGFTLLSVAAVAAVIVAVMGVLWMMAANSEKQKREEKKSKRGSSQTMRS